MRDSAKIEKHMSLGETVFRQSFDGLIDTINQKHLLPTQIENYEVFESGTSSVVALIEQKNTQPAILKTAYEAENIVGESLALSYWQQVVTTPDIYEIHTPDNSLPVAFFIAEFISSPSDNKKPAPRLKETPPDQRIEKGLSFEIGKELALIHNLPLPQDTTPFSITTIDDVLERTRQTLSSLLERRLLEETDTATIYHALETISKQSNDNNRVCHNDFLTYNLLVRNGKIVVFDPDAAINQPMADLANTILNTLVEVENLGEQEAQEILKGYESITKIDYEVLEAFFIVQCVRKTDKWLHKDREKKSLKAAKLIHDVPAFLRKNK